MKLINVPEKSKLNIDICKMIKYLKKENITKNSKIMKVMKTLKI